MFLKSQFNFRQGKIKVQNLLNFIHIFPYFGTFSINFLKNYFSLESSSCQSIPSYFNRKKNFAFYKSAFQKPLRSSTKFACQFIHFSTFSFYSSFSIKKKFRDLKNLEAILYNKKIIQISENFLIYLKKKQYVQILLNFSLKKLSVYLSSKIETGKLPASFQQLRKRFKNLRQGCQKNGLNSCLILQNSDWQGEAQSNLKQEKFHKKKTFQNNYILNSFPSNFYSILIPIYKDYFVNIQNENISTRIYPSKLNIKNHMIQLKLIIKSLKAQTQEMLIKRLAPKIRSWCEYYQIISNKKVLNYCDYLLFKILWRWSCRRHANKSRNWIKAKYFHNLNGKGWVFGFYNKNTSIFVCLPSHSDTNLIIHTSILNEKSPYDRNRYYWFQRAKKKDERI
nr:hypothetical protein [Trochiscia hystrix]